MCWLRALTILVAPLCAVSAHADIYQWEWVDPGDHSLGRQQSTTLAPDGDGRSAAPNAYLVDLDLTKAWLQAHDLHQAWFVNTTLTHADLSNADLTGHFFGFTTLRDANFSNAEIRRTGSPATVPPCRAAIRTGASRLSSSIRPRAPGRRPAWNLIRRCSRGRARQCAIRLEFFRAEPFGFQFLWGRPDRRRPVAPTSPMQTFTRRT